MIENNKFYTLTKFLEILKMNGVSTSYPTLEIKVRRKIIDCQKVVVRGKRRFPMYSGFYINEILNCVKKKLDWDKVKQTTEQFKNSTL